MKTSGYLSFNFSIKGRPCSNSPNEAQCIQITGRSFGGIFSSSSPNMFILPFIHKRALGLQSDAILMVRR